MFLFPFFFFLPHFSKCISPFLSPISSILFLFTTFWHWLDMRYTSLYLKKPLEELNTWWLLINNLINCKMTLTPSSLAFICEYNQLATSESLWLGPIASEFHSSVETAPDCNMLSVFQPFCKPSPIYLRLIPCKRSYIIGCLQTASYQAAVAVSFQSTCCPEAELDGFVQRLQWLDAVPVYCGEERAKHKCNGVKVAYRSV